MVIYYMLFLKIPINAAVGGHYSGVIFARIIFSLGISLLMLKFTKYNVHFLKSMFLMNV